MKEEIEKLRKRIKKQYEDLFEVDEKSDIPIHEKYVEQGDIQTIKKKKNSKIIK